MTFVKKRDLCQEIFGISYKFSALIAIRANHNIMKPFLTLENDRKLRENGTKISFNRTRCR